MRDCSYNGYFVDLYVRKSNVVGSQMYEKMGYIVYRRVLGYYGGGDGEEEEDALGTNDVIDVSFDFFD